MAFPVIQLLIGIGGFLLQMLFAPKPKDQYGPRLADINVASVSPGNPIVRHWGTMKLTGQILWVSKLIETKHVKKQSGGKGMGGGSAKQITYTYSVDVAIGVCAGPVSRVRRIRANQKTLWTSESDGVDSTAFNEAYIAEGTRLLDNEVEYSEAHVGAFFFAFNNYSTAEYDLSSENQAISYIMAHPLIPGQAPNQARVAELVGQMLDPISDDKNYEKYKVRFDGMTVYYGHEAQLPNGLIESYKEVGNVSGYRGVCYFVIKNLQLEDFGNSIPQFQVEVDKEDGDVYLADIVADICLESGMNYTEFDVDSGLGDIKVSGFAITQTSSARDVLQTLQKVYPFDGQENSYRLTFNWIERRPRALIRRHDFGAFESGQDQPPSEEITRQSELEMPVEVNLTYQEPARNFSQNTVKSRRMTTEGNQVEDIDIAICLAREEAKARCEAAMSNLFMSRRSRKVILPRKYIVIEPGDPILVEDEFNQGKYFGLLTTEVNVGANGLLEFTFVDHHPKSFVTALTENDVLTDDDDDTTLSRGSRTTAYMLDFPLMTDDEPDDTGFYASLHGSTNGWTGGVLLLDMSSGGTVPVFDVVENPDTAGSNWYTVMESDQGAPHGFVMNSIGAAECACWDYQTKIRVMLLNRDDTLSSVSQVELIRNPFNLIVCGDEIIQFANAVDKGNGYWELNTLLRGLRGTDWAVGQHVPGERFLRLTQGATQRISHDLSFLNVEGTFRAVSAGYGIDSARDFTFKNTGNSYRCYTPSITEAKKIGNDFRLQWEPRPRQNGQWLNGLAPELDQPYEKYEIDVLDEDGNVVRTEALDSLRQWVYDSTMQTTDFGSLQTSVQLNLYQMGEIVGRGFAKRVVI